MARHVGDPGSRNIVGRKAGDWRCQAQLGTGSFGIVHVWANETTKETIALKKCRFGPEVLLSEKVKQARKRVEPPLI